jgi:hypothetical protein
MVVSVAASGAEARRHRPRFEPTNLDLNPVGVIDADVESGFIHDGQGDQLMLADVELDVGILPRVEFDLDTSLWTSSVGLGTFQPGPAQFDNVWAGLKIGLVTGGRPGAPGAWGVGVQLGPRIALAPDAQGLGAEVLVIVEWTRRWGTVSLNVGGFSEPRQAGLHEVSRALVGAVDLAIPLGRSDVWTLTAEGFGVLNELTAQRELGASVGIACACSTHLGASLTALGGWIGDGPALGVLLGLSPQVRAWR